jgi:hypothetical protein
VTGVSKSGAVENIFGDWIGYDSACSTSHHVGNRAMDRGQSRRRAGIVGMTGPGCDGLTDRYDRQSVRKYVVRLIGIGFRDPDIQSERTGPAIEESSIAQPIEVR